METSSTEKALQPFVHDTIKSSKDTNKDTIFYQGNEVDIRFINQLAGEHVIYDDKSFKCKVCGKSFKQVSHLKEHNQIHMSDLKFQCCLCETLFNTSMALRGHKNQKQ